MRCTALTALFFALFALFSATASASPIFARQYCTMPACRDAVVPANTTGTPPAQNDRVTVTAIVNIISQLLGLLGNDNYNTPNNGPQPSTLVTTAQSSSAPPASEPTGTPQPVPTIKWFSEIAVPSPTSSGV